MPLNAAQLAELIECHAAALRFWVRPRCVSCDDVVQEAFCKLALADPPPDNPVAWLYRVCRNLAEKQRLSDHRRRQREEARASPEVVENAAERRLEVSETMAAIEQLDEELRNVLVARVWGQLSFEEIGRLCSMSAATAHRRYQSALGALKSALTSPCEKNHER